MKKEIINGIVTGLFSRIVSVLGYVMISGLVVRHLDKQNAGLWFLFFSIITFLSFLDCGLSPILGRQIGLASYKLNMKIRISNLYSTITKILYCVAIILILALIAIYFFFIHPYISRSILTAYCIFSAAFIIRFIANANLAILYGLGRVTLNNVVITIGMIVFIIGGSIALIKGYGLLGLCCAYFFYPLILLIVSKYIVSYQIGATSTFKFSKQVLAIIYEPCIQSLMVSLGAVLILQISNLMISTIMGVGYVSGFAVIKQMSEAIIMVSATISLNITPQVSIAKGKNETKTIQQLFALNIIIATLIAIGLSLLVFFYRDQISHIWLGKNTSFNYHLLIIMLITTVLEVHSISCVQTAFSSGYTKFSLIVTLSGVINVILSYFFIKELGILGAGLSIMVSQLVTNNWFSVFICIKHIRFQVLEYMKIIITIVIYLVIVFLSLYCIKSVTSHFNNLTQIVIGSVSVIILTLPFFIMSKKIFLELNGELSNAVYLYPNIQSRNLFR